MEDIHIVTHQCHSSEKVLTQVLQQGKEYINSIWQWVTCDPNGTWFAQQMGIQGLMVQLHYAQPIL